MTGKDRQREKKNNQQSNKEGCKERREWEWGRGFKQ